MTSPEAVLFMEPPVTLPAWRDRDGYPNGQGMVKGFAVLYGSFDTSRIQKPISVTVVACLWPVWVLWVLKLLPSPVPGPPGSRLISHGCMTGFYLF